MHRQLHDFVTRPAMLRQAIAVYQAWIEERLGAPIADAAIVETSHNFSQLGVEKILDLKQDQSGAPKSIRRLRSFVGRAEIPPGIPPLLGYSKAQSHESLRALLGATEQYKPSRIEWQDCPLLFQFHTISSPVIAFNIHYQPGPSSDCDLIASVLIAKRDCLEQLIRLLETVDRRETTPKLNMHRGSARRVAPCSWNDLVLNPTIGSLLKNDFEQFWKREKWFRDRHLPFRRGYLLHGPPGNGKSTAVRAMMCSQGIGAFTMRLFDREMADFDLDQLFDEALKERPAMILFEDLDRAFPRTGESKTQISMQHLLNCLDGVATGEGIVVVATANDPAALDPAILRRPGRFDRVVCFPNPNADLRQKYFQTMNPEVGASAFEQAAKESNGFSFAQLREAFVLAAQFAFERDTEVTEQHLLKGIRTMRQSLIQGSRHSNSAGFSSPTAA
jgi:hypothetical protein